MRALSKEISGFLRERGISCREICLGGTSVIKADIPEGGIRYIVPIDITASCPDEARAQSDLISAAVADLRKTAPAAIITEDRWNRQKVMMQERLLAHLESFVPLYARNCEIRRIDKLEAAAFLDTAHSYGDAACRYRYGMFLKRHTGQRAALASGIEPGTLVAVATFSNARRWIKEGRDILSYEWTRFASLPGIRINGGMGKMLRHFINEVKPDDIMSYADLEWSEGKVYQELGFDLEDRKGPVLFRIDDQWNRHPVKTVLPDGAGLFFMNFGSNKYRLKLTDYR